MFLVLSMPPPRVHGAVMEEGGGGVEQQIS